MHSAVLLATRNPWLVSCEIRARRGMRWLLSLPGTPHEVSLGVAVGMFVAVTPTPGFQMVLAAALAGVMRCSARAAMIMTFFSNPLTGAPLNVAAYLLGKPFFPASPALTPGELSAAFVEASTSFTGMLTLGERLLLPLLVGSIVLGLLLAPIGYAASRAIYSNRNAV